MPAFRLASASCRDAGPGARAAGAVASARRPLPAAETPSGKIENSALDATLFYQLLLGEIELREGQAGTAYQLMLDAAKRSKDEQLFRRATEIALQARAGDQALSATLAWRQALPESTDALRYQIQLLVALNRTADAEEPLGLLLRQTPRAGAARPDLGGAAFSRARRRPQRGRDAGRANAAALRRCRGHARRRAGRDRPRLARRRRLGQGARLRAARERCRSGCRRRRPCSRSTCCRRRPMPKRSSSASSLRAATRRPCACSTCARSRPRSGCPKRRPRSRC